MPKLFTVPEVARLFGLPDWVIRRLFERGQLPDPPRAGLTRLIPEDELPVIEKALRDAGRLKSGVKPS